MTIKTSHHVRHKVFIALMVAEKRATPIVSYEVADDLARQAQETAERIAPIYDSKNYAGALWLDREINKFLSGGESVIEI